MIEAEYYFLKLVIMSAVSAVVWVQDLTNGKGIFAGLNFALRNFPHVIRRPMFECEVCNSFWWMMLYMTFASFAISYITFFLWCAFGTMFISKMFVVVFRRLER